MLRQERIELLKSVQKKTAYDNRNPSFSLYTVNVYSK